MGKSNDSQGSPNSAEWVGLRDGDGAWAVEQKQGSSVLTSKQTYSCWEDMSGALLGFGSEDSFTEFIVSEQYVGYSSLTWSCLGDTESMYRALADSTYWMRKMEKTHPTVIILPEGLESRLGSEPETIADIAPIVGEATLLRWDNMDTALVWAMRGVRDVPEMGVIHRADEVSLDLIELIACTSTPALARNIQYALSQLGLNVESSLNAFK